MKAAGPAILMTTDPIGGVWSYTLDLCREMPGCGIALASMGRALRREERESIARLSNVELFESSFALEWMADPWRDVAAAGDWLLGLAERSGADIVHLNEFSHGALPWRIPTLVVGHSCVYSWFDAVRGQLPGGEWRRYRLMVARGLGGAGRVTAPSRWMLDELKRIYGGFNAAAPIYNGRDPLRFAAALKKNFILTAGRLWDPAKNIAALDAAAAYVPWPIYAAGDEIGPAGGARALLSSVHPLGRLDDQALSGWMSRAAIFALPASYEPFGLSILEAALSGCALVIGDIPSLREIWQNSALFVAPGDPSAVARALADLIRNPNLRRELARRGRRRAMELTPARMARSYLALYREILAETEARGAHQARHEGRPHA